MDTKFKHNKTTLKEYTLRELVNKYVNNPHKFSEFANIRYSPTQNELNTESSEFNKLENLAKELCTGVVNDAVDVVNTKKQSKFIAEIKNYASLSVKRMLGWPSMKDMDMNRLRLLISYYISEWKLSPGIKYCIQYQSSRTINASKIQDFLVIFSIPTKSCPNPQAVAYVYFTVESCSGLPDSESIFVKYTFEQYHKTYVINKDFDFQDSIIKLILVSKSRFYDKL